MHNGISIMSQSKYKTQFSTFFKAVSNMPPKPKTPVR